VGSILNDFLTTGTYQLDILSPKTQEKARSAGLYYINLVCKENGNSMPVSIIRNVPFIK
jgi:hypothetical protein